jgi:hypothetical protein
MYYTLLEAEFQLCKLIGEFVWVLVSRGTERMREWLEGVHKSFRTYRSNARKTEARSLLPIVISSERPVQQQEYPFLLLDDAHWIIV